MVVVGAVKRMRAMRIDPVGIVGLGLLGRGIAASLVGAGVHVVAFDTNSQARLEAFSFIENAVGEMVGHGVLTPQTAAAWREYLTICDSITFLKPCAFVIESVYEDLAVKRQVFEELEAIVGPDIPIASNTSALPITLLQQGRTHASRFLGMHWAQPCYATRFLEIIRGELTTEASLQLAVKLGRRVSKDPSIVNRDVPGFIINRLSYAMYREAAHLVELGVADVATIDQAFCNAVGLWASFCGPFRWIDITGGPGLYGKVMAGILPDLAGSSEVPALFANLEASRGAPDGRGFYTYEPGDAARWQKLFHEHAWQLKRLQERVQPPPGDGDDHR
jgi:3-hydroxybutyryl-CoA dehydrogenase